jgi:hypothetical protein
LFTLIIFGGDTNNETPDNEIFSNHLLLPSS